MNEPNDNTEVEKLDLSSLDVAEQKRQELVELFPEVRTEGGKIDFERLKTVLGEMVDAGRERYGMNWPGKAECMRTIQAPSMGTLLPMPKESVDWDTTENVIIEGDNLEVLKLLQKSYLGKVQLIYIDPPYNTGKEFVYPDNYTESLQTYLEYSGQVDSEGRRFGANSETQGRFHSRWMNMMYPRLYIARNLLSESGAVFISIDDNELDNLRKLCYDIFGEENFVSQVTVVSNPRGRQSDTFLATVHDYVLIFAKNIEECSMGGVSLTAEQRADFSLTDENGENFRLLGLRQRGAASKREDRPDMFFPIYVNPNDLTVSVDRSADHCIEVFPRKSSGEDGRWGWGKDKVRKDARLLVARLIERRGEYDIFVRDYLNKNGSERMRKAKTVWDDKSLNTQNGTQEVKALLNSDVMTYPKPVDLLKAIVSTAMCGTGELVMDFFAGSGTTAQAVMELNNSDGKGRRFLLVQLPEPTERTDYKTVSEVCRERVRQVSQRLKAEQKDSLLGQEGLDYGFRAFTLAASNFIPWDGTASNDAVQLANQLKLGIDHTRGDRTPQDLLFEVLLKSWGEPALSLNVGEETIEGVRVFSIAEGAFLICLEEKVTLEFIRALAARKPDRVVMRESAFAGNDQLKTNAVQTFKSQGVTSFKVV